jgi:hypothetical protein
MRYYLRFDQQPSGTFGEAQTGGVYSGVDVTALARNNSSSSPVVYLGLWLYLQQQWLYFLSTTGTAAAKNLKRTSCTGSAVYTRRWRKLHEPRYASTGCQSRSRCPGAVNGEPRCFGTFLESQKRLFKGCLDTNDVIWDSADTANTLVYSFCDE